MDKNGYYQKTKRQHYQATDGSDEMRQLALFWWSEELTDRERQELLRAFGPLMVLCKGLGEVGVAELAFKLRLHCKDSEVIA